MSTSSQFLQGVLPDWEGIAISRQNYHTSKFTLLQFGGNFSNTIWNDQRRHLLEWCKVRTDSRRGGSNAHRWRECSWKLPSFLPTLLCKWTLDCLSPLWKISRAFPPTKSLDIMSIFGKKGVTGQKMCLRASDPWSNLVSYRIWMESPLWVLCISMFLSLQSEDAIYPLSLRQSLPYKNRFVWSNPDCTFTNGLEGKCGCVWFSGETRNFSPDSVPQGEGEQWHHLWVPRVFIVPHNPK